MNPAMALKLLGALKSAKGAARGVGLPALKKSATAATSAATSATRHTGRLAKQLDTRLGKAGDSMRVPPWMSAMAGAGAGVGLYDLGAWGASSLTGDGEISERQLRLMMLKQAARGETQRRAMDPYKQALEANKQSLAQTDPALMNSILGGQPLMDGEEVLGGEPRMDLLDQIAMQMASGEFQGFEEELF